MLPAAAQQWSHTAEVNIMQQKAEVQHAQNHELGTELAEAQQALTTAEADERQLAHISYYKITVTAEQALADAETHDDVDHLMQYVKEALNDIAGDAINDAAE